MNPRASVRRRLFGSVLAVVIVLGGSGLVARGALAAHRTQDITTITIWWPAWGGGATDILKNVVGAAYKKVKPKIRISWLFLPNYLSTQDKLLPAIAGNHAPDGTYTQGETDLTYALKHAFNGALTPMVQCLLESKDLNAAELAELESLIKAKKKSAKK